MTAIPFYVQPKAGKNFEDIEAASIFNKYFLSIFESRDFREFSNYVNSIVEINDLAHGIIEINDPAHRAIKKYSNHSRVKGTLMQI